MAIFCGVVDASWLLVYMVGSLVRLPMSRNESVRGNEADDSGLAWPNRRDHADCVRRGSSLSAELDDSPLIHGSCSRLAPAASLSR